MGWDAGWRFGDEVVIGVRRREEGGGGRKKGRRGAQKNKQEITLFQRGNGATITKDIWNAFNDALWKKECYIPEKHFMLFNDILTNVSNIDFLRHPFLNAGMWHYVWNVTYPRDAELFLQVTDQGEGQDKGFRGQRLEVKVWNNTLEKALWTCR